MSNEKTCKQCMHMAHSQQGQYFCKLTSIICDPETDFCSKGYFDNTDNAPICAVCGEPIIPSISRAIVEVIEGQVRTFCKTCYEHRLNTCKTCKASCQCDFETNPIKIEKLVQQQVQRGPVVQVFPIKNPERIKETCMKVCSCWNDEQQMCNREVNVCGKYEEHVYTP